MQKDYFIIMISSKILLFNCESKYQNAQSLTLPVSVDPVNEILATRGLSHRTFPTAGVFLREHVTTFTTPGGTPASSAICQMDGCQKITWYYRYPVLEVS